MNQIAIEKIHREGDIDKVYAYDRTKFWSAVKNSDIDSINQLLEYNCNVNIPDNRGFSPLLMAIDNGRDDIVHILLKNNCDIHERDIWHALMKRKDVILKMMLQTGKFDMSTVDEYQQTYLYLAAAHGFHELIKPLIHAGCNINQCDDMGRTPLIAAIDNGHYRVVLQLLKRASRVPLDMNTTFENGKTALYVAVEHENIRIVRALLGEKECDPNICCNGDLSPMRLAVYNQNIDIVKLLLGRHDCELEFGLSAHSILCYAVESKNIQIVKMLLDTKRCTDVGLLPFCIAIRMNNVKMVSLLLQYGAKECYKMRDYWTHNRIPLCLAAMEGHTEICVLLIHSRFSVNTPDYETYTPLHLACFYEHEHTVAALLNWGHEIHVNSTDNNKTTALWIASYNGNMNIVNMLIAAQCDVNIPNIDSYTPIRIALQKNHMHVARELWAHGARIDTHDADIDYIEEVCIKKFVQQMTKADNALKTMFWDEMRL